MNRSPQKAKWEIKKLKASKLFSFSSALTHLEVQSRRWSCRTSAQQHGVQPATCRTQMAVKKPVRRVLHYFLLLSALCLLSKWFCYKDKWQTGFCKETICSLASLNISTGRGEKTRNVRWFFLCWVKYIIKAFSNHCWLLRVKLSEPRAHDMTETKGKTTLALQNILIGDFGVRCHIL